MLKQKQSTKILEKSIMFDLFYDVVVLKCRSTYQTDVKVFLLSKFSNSQIHLNQPLVLSPQLLNSVCSVNFPLRLSVMQLSSRVFRASHPKSFSTICLPCSTTTNFETLGGLITISYFHLGFCFMMSESAKNSRLCMLTFFGINVTLFF